MSSRWFRINSGMIYSLAARRLNGREFRAAFIGALAGKETALSPFIKGPYTRPLSNEWKIIRQRIFERDDFTCAYCGARGVKLECDHIVPVARGGNHEDENLTTSCKPCNRAKAAKALEEWLK